MSSGTQSQIDTCLACESGGIDRSLDEFEGVCTDCGFVIHNDADHSAPNWTVSGQQDGDTTQDDWMAACRVQNATEQQLAQAFNDLENLADRLDIPIELRRNAADVYCEAFLAGTTDGRDTATMIAACTRLTSLQAEHPIPTGRLTESSTINSKKFHCSYSALRDDLDQASPTPEPTDYLPFLAEEFVLNDEHLQASAQLLENIADERSLVGKDPGGIAAAALYLTWEEQTQSSVAEAIGVSTETVRKRVTQLRELAADG